MISRIAQDRRTRRRYPVDLQLQFRVLNGRRPSLTGTGTIINMSSGGIAFRSDTPLTPSMYLELSIHWPVLLNNTRPLKLVMTGRVVRSDEQETAVKTDHYEFKTKASPEVQAMMQQSLTAGFRV